MDVGEDSDLESLMNRPRSEVDELGEEDESSKSMSLGEEDLEDDGELFWRVSFLMDEGESWRRRVSHRQRSRDDSAVLEPHLQRREMLDVELGGFVFVDEGRDGGISSGLLGLKEFWELSEASLDGEIPRVPKRMVVGWRECWFRARSAVVRPHDPFGEEEVPEESCDEEILPEQPPEEILGEDEPGDGIRDRGEDPVELS